MFFDVLFLTCCKNTRALKVGAKPCLDVLTADELFPFKANMSCTLYCEGMKHRVIYSRL